MFYEITLQVNKVNEKGEEKKVTERYITDMLLFAEAEIKGYAVYNNECDVVAIKRSKIAEIINDKVNDYPFFKAVIFDVFTTDSGEEKELDYLWLVCAEDIQSATQKVLEFMKQGYGMGLKSISRTKILDVLK